MILLMAIFANCPKDVATIFSSSKELVLVSSNVTQTQNIWERLKSKVYILKDRINEKNIRAVKFYSEFSDFVDSFLAGGIFLGFAPYLIKILAADQIHASDSAFLPVSAVSAMVALYLRYVKNRAEQLLINHFYKTRLDNSAWHIYKYRFFRSWILHKFNELTSYSEESSSIDYLFDILTKSEENNSDINKVKILKQIIIAELIFRSIGNSQDFSYISRSRYDMILTDLLRKVNQFLENFDENISLQANTPSFPLTGKELAVIEKVAMLPLLGRSNIKIDYNEAKPIDQKYYGKSVEEKLKSWKKSSNDFGMFELSLNFEGVIKTVNLIIEGEWKTDKTFSISIYDLDYILNAIAAMPSKLILKSNVKTIMYNVRPNLDVDAGTAYPDENMITVNFNGATSYRPMGNGNYFAFTIESIIAHELAHLVYYSNNSINPVEWKNIMLKDGIPISAYSHSRLSEDDEISEDFAEMMTSYVLTYGGLNALDLRTYPNRINFLDELMDVSSSLREEVLSQMNNIVRSYFDN